MVNFHIPIRIGIVGHRYFQSQEVETFISESCQRIFLSLQHRYSSLIAVSAIAQGADSIFAQAALALNIPLEIVCPFETYYEDFACQKSSQIYTSLRNAASQEKSLNFVHRSEDAYYAAMQWVVEGSDLLIAAWDGKKGKGKGGTADAVNRAMDMGHSWIHLDVMNKGINYHCADYPYLSNTIIGYGRDFQTL